MIGLVEALDGTFPLSDIASIAEVPAAPGKAEHYTVRKFSGAPSSKLFTWEYAELMARPVQLMPAEAGTYLLRAYDDDAKVFIDKMPVLAWALSVDGLVRPVTPGGVYRRGDHSPFPDYLQQPEGTICEFGYEAEPDPFTSVAKVIAHLAGLKERRRAAAALPMSTGEEQSS